MRVIIAGSRDYNPTMEEIQEAVDASDFEVTEVVCGGAKGVDYCGMKWAASKNLPCAIFSADWEQLGRMAGPIRNDRMAKYADALIAFNKNDSPGTLNMIATARDRGLKLLVVNV